MASPYDSFEDPYCYKNSFVLKNKAGHRDAGALETLELDMQMIRAAEPLPTGTFDTGHYRAVHRHLFQDVYRWAGRYRTVRIAREGAMFCYPEFIAAQMDALFQAILKAPFVVGASQADFVRDATRFLGDLNAIHPFRDGNGRTQLSFLFLLGERAGHHLDMTRIRAEPMLAAMVKSFQGRLGPLEAEIAMLCL